MDKKPKILLVDDEKENIINYKILFRKHFEVFTAVSAKEALSIIENEDIQVVVSDHIMPEMTGIELFEILSEKKPHISRILLSGYVELEVVLDAINRGRVFQYINKPFDPNFLKAAINKAIEIQNLRQTNIGLTKDLEVQKQKYQLLFDEASDGLLVGVPPGEIVDANKKMCEITGYSKQELIGANITLLFDEEELKRKPLRYDLVNSGQTIIMERLIRRKEGRLVDVEMSTNRQPDGRMQAIIREITARKEEEERIKRNEERLSSALEASNEGIWEWNLNTNETYYSPTWYEMLGYKNLEFPQNYETWKELCHPDDYIKATQNIQEMLLSGSENYEATFRMKQNDGSWKWIMGKGKVHIRGEDNKVLQLIGTNTDVHRLKVIEEELKFKNNFEHLFFKISNSFINMPYDKIDAGINKAMEEIAQFAQSDYAFIFIKSTNDNSYNLTHSSSGDLISNLRQPLTLRDHSWLLNEISNKNYVSVSGLDAVPDDTDHTANYFRATGIESFVFIPLIYKDMVIGMLGLGAKEDEVFWSGENVLLLKICSEVFVNALENKKQAAKIKEMNEHLEQRVDQRTQQLKELNDELQSFSYSVSHDMRAPLRIIQSYIQIINEDFLDKIPYDLHKYLNNIEENTTHLTRLIDNILSFSKLTQSNLKVSKISLRSIFEEIYSELLKLEKGNRNIELILDESLDDLTGDETMIRQVISNILSNSIKYTREKENAVVTVKTKRTLDDTVLMVEDNGIGFNMKHHQKIFGVFQRLHSEDKYEGDGIGLAFVQRIVNKHMGRVWAESVVGEGTKFFIALPNNIDD